MAVDMAAREQPQLFHAAGVAVDHAGIVHEFGQPDTGRMAHHLRQIARLQRRTGGFHMGRRHAGRQLHADVDQRVFGRLLKITNTRQADDIGDLMRIADGGGHATGADAAVELERRDERAFDMQMRVDETRHQRQAGDVDHLAPLIARAKAYDGVASDRHIALYQRAGHDAQHPPPAQHQIRRFIRAPLRDPRFEIRHAPAFPCLPAAETKAPQRSSA